MSPVHRLVAVVSFLALLPGSAAPQEYGLLLGLGRTAWSGSAGSSWGGSTDLTLGALTGEWRLGGALAGRIELGGGARVADLGRSGIFGEQAHVSFHRIQLGALLRPTFGVADGALRVFVEGGAHGWLSTLCDVDLEGGPGFFGGETVDCAEWVSDDDSGPLVARGSGLAWTVGTGLKLDRWAFGLRYEREGRATLGTPLGEARPSVGHVTGQWTFRTDRSQEPVRPGSTPAAAIGAEEGAHERRSSGSAGDAVAAGVLEWFVPTLGYAHAGRWSEGLLPNAVRLTGPVVMVFGWGTDSDDVLIGGAVVFALGTGWAVVGAARSGWRKGSLTPPDSGMFFDVGPTGAAQVGFRWGR